MNAIIIQGLKVSTRCRYVKFTEGKWLKVAENLSESYIEITFLRGLRSSDVFDSRIEILADLELRSTDYIRIHNPIISIGGLVVKKIKNGPYSFSQYLVSNIDKFIMDYDEYGCKVLIPADEEFDVCKYVELINRNPFLEVVDYSKVEKLYNFNSTNLLDNDAKLNSTNEFKFSSKAKYEKYLLRMIDVHKSLIENLKKIATEYGVQLVRYPIDENVSNVNRLIYKITELGSQVLHPTGHHPLRYEVQHKSLIEIEVSFPDLILFNDFKTRYQNVDLFTNFTEFYTTDKLGNNWLSCLKWNPINTDFNQDYTQDSQGNLAFQAMLTAELHYYVVYDETFISIRDTIVELIAESTDKLSELTEVITIDKTKNRIWL